MPSGSKLYDMLGLNPKPEPAPAPAPEPEPKSEPVAVDRGGKPLKKSGRKKKTDE